MKNSKCAIWIVQRWQQYKLGKSSFTHDVKNDFECDSQEDAERYAITADSGIEGDMRYRYKIIPPIRN